MRYLFTITLVTLSLFAQSQQRPFINSISKTTGTVGEEISISGSGFSADCKVYFGAALANSTFSSASLITAIVPGNATHDAIRVVDSSTGLGCSSTQLFFLSFAGTDFDINQLASRQDFSTGNQLSTDLCSCDFNGDGLNDFAVANEDNSQVNIFTNTTSGGALSFTNQSVNNNNIETTGTACGDLNNDGKDEIVFTAKLATATAHVYIYETNTISGTISINLIESFLIPDNQDGSTNGNPRKIRIKDMDGDGINDLILGNKSEASILIYRSEGTNTVSLATQPYIIRLPDVADLGEIDVQDLNNDGLPDVVALPFNGANGLIYPFRNTSTPGTVSLVAEASFSNPAQRISIIIGDLNQDGFADVISTDQANDRVFIHQNTTTGIGSSLSFDNELIQTLSDARGVGLGDINGDGRLDIIASSTEDRQIGFIINQSSSNTISLANTQTISTSSVPRNIVISDLNSDGKSDIAFTHRSISQTIGELSVITNTHCVEPVITPEDLTFCLNSPFTLSATKTLGATYNWSLTSGNGNITNNGDNATITITGGATATIQVTVNSNDGLCSTTNSLSIGLTNGSPPAPPTITKSSNSDPICAGTALTLTAPLADNYFWILPDGTVSNNRTVEFTSLSPSNSGTYELRVQSGSACISDPQFEEIIVSSPPSIGITNNGNNNFCEVGGSTELQAPDYDGFSYQWNNSAGPISGATNSTLTVNTTEQYSVTLTSQSTGCTSDSPEYGVSAIPVPRSLIDADGEICVNVPLQLTAASTGDDGFSLNYSWDFGDGTSSTESNVSKTWSTPDAYAVRLTTRYNEITDCSSDMNQTITVSAIPNLSISTENDITEKCPSDSIRLELPQGFESYLWSTGDTGFFTYAKTSQNQSTVDITANVVTNIGCSTSASSTISNFPNSGITFSSSEGAVEGDSIVLGENQISVLISAEVTGGSDYVWEPEELLDNTEGSTVRVFPARQVNEVTVTATDANNCRESAIIKVINQGVIPRKTFSPNGDGMGFECWEILNTTNLNGCEIFIFDSRGRNIFVADSPFIDNCVWSGQIENTSGQAPEGIYYFVLKCENAEFSRTGSILLAR